MSVSTRIFCIAMVLATLTSDTTGQTSGFYRVRGDSPFRLLDVRADGNTTWKTGSTSWGEYFIEQASDVEGPWRVVAYDRRTTPLISFRMPVAPWPSDINQRSDFMVGGLVCDYLSYKKWGGIWRQTDLMQVLKTNGFQWMRAWVTTISSDDLRRTDPALWGKLLPWKNEFWSSVEFAERILQEAQDKGFRLDLVLFLSHMAAHAGTQDAPPEWVGRSVSETASLLEDYTYRTVSYYRGRGLNIELYEIGNEIEWGILNFRPGERIPIPPGVDRTADMNYMRSNVWNVEAVLLKSAVAGVKRADPGAKIVLHIDTLAYSPGNLIARTFFQTMIEQGVVFDYAGLSLPYPSPGWWPQYYSSRFWYERVLTVVKYLRQLGKSVIFCEGNYPNRPDSIQGPPMQDYAYSPEGQAKWVRELLVFLTNQDNVAGFFYWYPEYFPGMGATDPNSGNVQSTGLFATETEIRPALREFRIVSEPTPNARTLK